MKNGSLVIFLLVILILAVIGLNIRKYTEVFTEDTKKSCFDIAQKQFPQYINSLSAATDERSQLLIQLLHQSHASVHASDGAASETILGSPCIFPKAYHDANNVDTLNCKDLKFPRSNLNGDCIYDIENTGHINDISEAAIFVYKKKVEPQSQQAGQSFGIYLNDVSNNFIAAHQNATAYSTNAAAVEQNTLANNRVATLRTENDRVTRDLITLGGQEAQEKDKNIKLNNSIRISESINSTLPQGRSEYVRAPLHEGMLIRRAFNLVRPQDAPIVNLTNMNRAFNNMNQDKGLLKVSNFSIPEDNYIAIEYYGFIRFPRQGVYTFGLRSDDASDIAIYDFNNSRWNVVASAYGYKPPEKEPDPNTSGKLYVGLSDNGYQNLLEYYPVRIRFHEHDGGQELNVLWIQPGETNWSYIPFSAFSCNFDGVIRSNGYPEPRVYS